MRELQLRVLTRSLGFPKRHRSVNSGEVAEWSNAAALKAAEPQGSVSSNLTLSAKSSEQGGPIWKNHLRCLLSFFGLLDPFLHDADGGGAGSGAA